MIRDVLRLCHILLKEVLVCLPECQPRHVRIGVPNEVSHERGLTGVGQGRVAISNDGQAHLQNRHALLTIDKVLVAKAVSGDNHDRTEKVVVRSRITDVVQQFADVFRLPRKEPLKERDLKESRGEHSSTVLLSGVMFIFAMVSPNFCAGQSESS